MVKHIITQNDGLTLLRNGWLHGTSLLFDLALRLLIERNSSRDGAIFTLRLVLDLAELRRISVGNILILLRNVWLDSTSFLLFGLGRLCFSSHL